MSNNKRVNYPREGVDLAISLFYQYPKWTFRRIADELHKRGHPKIHPPTLQDKMVKIDPNCVKRKKNNLGVRPKPKFDHIQVVDMFRFLGYNDSQIAEVIAERYPRY